MRWLLLCLLATPSLAVDWITNDTKSINWSTVCGVPGGIPNRVTIAQTLAQNATAADITTALGSASSNQVVFLQAGTYSSLGSGAKISWTTKHGRTLRGAGMGQTILVVSGAGSTFMETDDYGFTGLANISSGYTKGSTSIVMSAALASGFSPGNQMLIRQSDDTNFVYAANPPSTRMPYLHRIETTNGTTITFSPPLMFGLTAGLTPQAGYVSGGPGIMRASVENLTILNTGARDDVIKWNNGYQCWWSGIEVSNMVGSGLFVLDSLQCELRRSYFHDALSFPNQADGYGVYIIGDGDTVDGTSSFNLVEDNIFERLFVAMWQTRASGNAFLFNFCTNGGQGGFTHQLGIMNAGHGPHIMMTLWEGNVGEQWQHDGYHGSASHQTVFRNYIHGLHPTYSDNRKMIDITRGSYYYVVAGNVLGHSSWTADQYEMTGQPGYATGNVIYRLGYPNVANNGTDPGDIGNPWYHTPPYPDPQSASTLERVYNYDYKSGSIVNSTSGVPNSIYYSSKPSYFGYLGWPAYDPASPSSASATNIPAGWRYVQGYPYTNEVPAGAVAGGDPWKKRGLKGLRLRR